MVNLNHYNSNNATHASNKQRQQANKQCNCSEENVNMYESCNAPKESIAPIYCFNGLQYAPVHWGSAVITTQHIYFPPYHLTPRLDPEKPFGEDSGSNPAYHHLSQESSYHFMIPFRTCFQRQYQKYMVP